jgi:hypothetical protein
MALTNHKPASLSNQENLRNRAAKCLDHTGNSARSVCHFPAFLPRRCRSRCGHLVHPASPPSSRITRQQARGPAGPCRGFWKRRSIWSRPLHWAGRSDVEPVRRASRRLCEPASRSGGKHSSNQFATGMTGESRMWSLQRLMEEKGNMRLPVVGPVAMEGVPNEGSAWRQVRGRPCAPA